MVKKRKREKEKGKIKEFPFFNIFLPSFYILIFNFLAIRCFTLDHSILIRQLAYLNQIAVNTYKKYLKSLIGT